MRAAIFHGPGDLRMEDVPDPEPGPGEVLVDVRAAATCGTDLKSYRRGHPKLFPVLPSRFGHEFAGVVRAVGDGVTGFSPGQRVVAANTAPCGHCWACTRGRLSLCENLEFLNGAFAEQVVIPAAIVARNTYVMPDSLSFEAAAPLEPLATVVHGIDESGISLGDTVVVHGAGPIGLMFTRLATLRGASVVSVDQTPWRLEQARAAGAVETIDLSDLPDPDSRVAAIKARTPGGRGADVSIEAVGLPAVWEQAVRTLRPGGTAVLFGGTPKGAPFSVDSSAMHYEEYTLKGVFHHTPDYVRTAVELLSTGKVDGTMLVTEVRPLEALVDSLEDMAAGRGSKFILQPGMQP
ncbi:alcohol dehydrogenase catalytic domain-containing protein [Kineococcus endophyticus]|uniref:Alcohol dehydrogenase catalytic domain-containing protein n=1 Tax=Kineococcus endophyticus TaxID=1181883 RepID=A0ABV3P6P5_9ACTN